MPNQREYLFDDVALGMCGKDLLSVHDLNQKEIWRIFQVASELKKETKTGINHYLLLGKTLAMIFLKPSTRTRISFEVGMLQLGGHPIFLSSRDLQLKRGETIFDTAKILSRYVNGVMIRAFSHKDVEDLATYSDIPVINGLTDLLHPCQALADYFTVYEKFGTLKGLNMVYIGDGNNMAHSLMYCGAKVGMHVTVVCPKELQPDQEIVKTAKKDGKSEKVKIEITDDLFTAVKGAHVIYTDVWASMGEESEIIRKTNILKPYQVNKALIEATGNSDVIVMHCLPAHRGAEITDEVIDGPNSVVFDEAENRLHVQKAILALLMQDKCR